MKEVLETFRAALEKGPLHYNDLVAAYCKLVGCKKRSAQARLADLRVAINSGRVKDIGYIARSSPRRTIYGLVGEPKFEALRQDRKPTGLGGLRESHPRPRNTGRPRNTVGAEGLLDPSARRTLEAEGRSLLPAGYVWARYRNQHDRAMRNGIDTGAHQVFNEAIQTFEELGIDPIHRFDSYWEGEACGLAWPRRSWRRRLSLVIRSYLPTLDRDLRIMLKEYRRYRRVVHWPRNGILPLENRWLVHVAELEAFGMLGPSAGDSKDTPSPPRLMHWPDIPLVGALLLCLHFWFFARADLEPGTSIRSLWRALTWGYPEPS